MGSNLKIQNLNLLNVQVSEFPLIPTFSMFNFISSSRTRTFPQFRISIKTSLPFNKLHSLSLSSSSSPVPVSLSENTSNEEDSFKVSYLINTIGLSPELAISRAKYLRIKTSEKPNNVLAILIKHGFTKTQISSMVERNRQLILCDPQMTLLPKLGFLSSIGLSTAELSSVITAVPHILNRSLEKIIIPAYNILRNLVGSDDKAAQMIKQYPQLLIHHPEVEKIAILQEVGVPEENIVVSMQYLHKGYKITADKYRMMVEKVKEMGFDPSDMKFLRAIRTMKSNEQSFEVSYLINTIGLSPEITILRAPPNLKFNTSEKPDNVLAVFKKHGFTKTQISSIVEKYPQLILCNPQKTLLPKLGFLSSIGLSTAEIPSVITAAPHFLKRSLKKIVIPSYNLLRNLVGSDDKAVEMIKRYPMVLTRAPEVDNIQILQEVGVPKANIVSSMIYNSRSPNAFTPTADAYRMMVEKVMEMGFDPSQMKFLNVIHTMRSISKSTCEHKLQALKKYGWSDREILFAFENQPHFIKNSEDKIVRVMDFLMNRMGMEAAAIANWPGILGMSLEKRIIPRCLVYQVLLERGLFDSNRKLMSIITMLSLTETQFLSRVIKRYMLDKSN